MKMLDGSTRRITNSGACCRVFNSLRQKWRSRPGDGAGSFDPVVGDGEGGDSTGFLLKCAALTRRA